MTTVICNIGDCIHRSKRRLKKWHYADGAPCYGCTLKHITISRVFDLDGDIEAVAGRENMARCAFYECQKPNQKTNIDPDEEDYEDE